MMNKAWQILFAVSATCIIFALTSNDFTFNINTINSGIIYNPLYHIGNILLNAFGIVAYIIATAFCISAINMLVFNASISFDLIILGVILLTIYFASSFPDYTLFDRYTYGGWLGNGVLNMLISSQHIPLLSLLCAVFGIISVFFGMNIVYTIKAILTKIKKYKPQTGKSNIKKDQSYTQQSNNKYTFDAITYEESNASGNISPAEINANTLNESKKTGLLNAGINTGIKKESNALSDNRHSQLPDISILTSKRMETVKVNNTDAISQKLLKTMDDFGISGKIITYTVGPVITRFEFEPADGIKVSRVVSLESDIARAISAISVRMYLIPGRTTIGIEIPNNKKAKIYMGDIYTPNDSIHDINLCLGVKVDGSPFSANLANMPHLLIAGATGSGKSVGLNVIIASMLFTKTQHDCKMIMIDPKMLEMSMYNSIPHLMMPVITDTSKAISALKWAVHEMEMRYKTMSNLKVRNIAHFNEIMLNDKITKSISIEKNIGFDRDTKQQMISKYEIEKKPLPRLVIIIDELADLMITAGKEIEGLLQRIAQMGRAAGIHLIVATQRPSVDVITGTIKANFPSRISFHLATKADSRTILEAQGAEKLLGQGDMLYVFHGQKPLRLHSPMLTEEQCKALIAHLEQYKAEKFIELDDFIHTSSSDLSAQDDQDELIYEAMQIAEQEKKISISFLQRKLRIGYNRAARIIEQMDKNGMLSQQDKTGKRTFIGKSN